MYHEHLASKLMSKKIDICPTMEGITCEYTNSEFSALKDFHSFRNVVNACGKHRGFPTESCNKAVN